MPQYPLKRRRPDRPDMLTRAQLHTLVGKAVCDYLLREPNNSHFDDYTAEWLVTEIMDLLSEQPYY